MCVRAKETERQNIHQSNSSMNPTLPTFLFRALDQALLQAYKYTNEPIRLDGVVFSIGHMRARSQRERQRQGGGGSKHMRECVCVGGGGGGIHKRTLLTFYAN